MAQYDRLCSGDPMSKPMRPAMAMIELIFAIVIIAISVVTIPSMMSVANSASKVMAIDEDVMSRLSGWTIDKFQARWDGNYSASGSGPLTIDTMTDLNCSRAGGYRIGSEENVTSMQCNTAEWNTAIPTPSTDGNLSLGIEQLNGGEESLTITPVSGTPYSVTATYEVDYVSSVVSPLNGSNTQTATWTLGSSDTMNSGDTGTLSHLKRVVTRFKNDSLGIDMTLTFFKSNKGN